MELVNQIDINQMLLAALTLTVAGVIGFWCRDVPMKLWGLIRRELTTTVYITSAHISFYNLMAYLEENYKDKNFRNFKLTNGKWGDDRTTTIGIGYGYHFIRFNGIILYVRLERQDSQGTSRDKETITVTKLGRSRKSFDLFFDSIAVDKEKENMIQLYKMTDYWCPINQIPKRSLDTIFLDQNIKDLLMKTIDMFISEEQWYLDNGIPYHLGILLHGKPGTGKAQPYSTKIPTPAGITLMGDLQIGNKVFDQDGKLTTVTGIFEQGVKDVYQITFNDGRTAECCKDHLWRVSSLSHGGRRYQTLTIEEILQDYKREAKIQGNRDQHRYRYSVQLNGPVEYGCQPVPIDPWVLGCFIGNGCCRQPYLTISSPDDEIPSRIAEICGFQYKHSHETNFSYLFYDQYGNLIRTDEFLDGVPEILEAYSHTKSIPECYMYNDIHTRKELMKGLMDTDGSIVSNEGRYNVSFSSTSKKLLEQMQYLLWSFGFRGNIGQDKRSDKYKSGFCGELLFNIPNKDKHLFFSVSYKLKVAMDAILIPQDNHYDRLTIKDIKLVRQEQCRCIMVDNPEHLYLTEDFIVTHNSSLIRAIASQLDYDIYYLSSQKLYKIEDCMCSLPKKSIIVIEDIDCEKVVHSREKKKSENNIVETVGDAPSTLSDALSMISFSDVLNALDGICSAHGRILITTTNHPEKLDKALMRPGRVDLKVEVGYVNNETFAQFTQRFFGKTETDIILRDELTCATLQSLILQKKSYDTIINYARKKD